MMDTREVAEYLRLKERRVYDLVRRGVIPHLRATGKLLFPRDRIDAWLAATGDVGVAPAEPASTHATHRAPPAIIAGSHDPLLDWSARANPLRIRSIADLGRQRLRVAPRQDEAGSQRLFLHELVRAGVDANALDWLPQPALAETDLAAIVAAGQADVGFGIEAVARARRLTFIPVTVERFDLVALRRDVFEPPLQALLGWTRTPEFAAEAKMRGGYDVAMSGRVVLNL